MNQQSYHKQIRRNLYFWAMGVLHLTLRMTPNAVRIIVLKIFGAKIEKNVYINSRAKFDFPWRLIIGKNCWISDGAYFDCRGGAITVGENCDISPNVRLHTLSHHPKSESMELKNGNITIGQRVWLCTSCVILPNVTIGEASVVGANCVINKSLPKKTLVKIQQEIQHLVELSERATKIDRNRF